MGSVSCLAPGLGRNLESPAMVAAGESAPAFECPDQDGRSVRLADLTGRWAVLWWYPKAGTRG